MLIDLLPADKLPCKRLPGLTRPGSDWMHGRRLTDPRVIVNAAPDLASRHELRARCGHGGTADSGAATAVRRRKDHQDCEVFGDVMETVHFVRLDEEGGARPYVEGVATAREASTSLEHYVDLVLGVRDLVVDPSGGDAVGADAHSRDANVLRVVVGSVYRRSEAGRQFDVRHQTPVAGGASGKDSPGVCIGHARHRTGRRPIERSH